MDRYHGNGKQSKNSFKQKEGNMDRLWECRSCGATWDDSQLLNIGDIPTCGDAYCGGTCDVVGERVELKLTDEQIQALQPLLKLCESNKEHYSIHAQAWPEDGVGRVVFRAMTLDDLRKVLARMEARYEPK